MTLYKTMPAMALLLVATTAGCGGEALDEAAGAGAGVATIEQAQGMGGSMSTTLSGPAIGGVVPEGDAKVGIFAPNTLELRLKNVNLPSGTRLTVSIGGYDIGTASVSSGEVQANLPVGFQVGLNSLLVVRNGATAIVWNTWH